MKRSNLFFFKSVFFLILTLVVWSCGSDDSNGPDILLPKLDGLYVYGEKTVTDEPGNAESKMNPAILDPNQGAQVNQIDGVFGKFIFIDEGGSIQLAFVDNEIGTVYGSPGGGLLDSSIVAGGVMNDLVQFGDLVKDSQPISVSQRGLYYLYVDMNNLYFVLSPVKANIIGDATPLQWSAGIPLPLKSTSAEKTVFEGTGIELSGATGYRYRFNDGWHFYQSNDIVTLSSLGVESYGEAWDTGINDLGFYLDNIPHKETGIFTVTLTFNAATGEWSEEKIKTGELLNDYSDTEYGWFGNAYYVSGDVEGAWDAIHLVKKPEVQGDTLYNWTWDLELIEGRSFVLRQSPDGAWITYGGAAKIGAAFDNGQIVKEEGQDNYFVSQGGLYEVIFTINAKDEGRILTINPQ